MKQSARKPARKSGYRKNYHSPFSGFARLPKGAGYRPRRKLLVLIALLILSGLFLIRRTGLQSVGSGTWLRSGATSDTSQQSDENISPRDSRTLDQLIHNRAHQ